MMDRTLWSTLGGGLVAFLVAGASTWGILQGTRRWRLLDRPNERSSHQVPMPTGAGLAIIAGFWSGLVVLRDSPVFASGEMLRAWGGSTLVLLAVAVDDLVRPLKVGEKLILMFLAVGIWLGWGPRLEEVALPVVGRLELGWWSWGLTALWFLALGNAFNFMDGIDGITAVQTLSVGCFALVCFWQLGSAWGGAALALAAGAGGFLIFNFPPGRIFMGDVGSQFIGFALAALGVFGEQIGLPIWIFAAFMGYYLFDTGYTLVRRALRGENLLKAHRKHLYQRLNKLGWSHRRIDLGVLLINLILGTGGCAYLFISSAWGALLLALGGGLLLVGTIWTERKDRSFG